jgi:purine-nucleoside phosphorylase/SAM-dependent methyltransferase
MKLISGNKQYNEPSVFTPENLLREARRQKGIADCKVPEVCILDPDGDLVAYLLKTDQGTINKCWACYHTKLYNVRQEGYEFAVLGCAVGSSFAVLVAEQLFASGCKMLISVTSAGILDPEKNNSKFILIEKALRDEGTSNHYLPPSESSSLNPVLQKNLLSYYRRTGINIETGISWTTDAPYRETQTAIDEAKKAKAICVEMEAAALYAFARAKNKTVICFAHITNTMAQNEGDFEKGEEMGSLDTLELIHFTINAMHKGNASYWDHIYSTKKSHEVSWTQDIPKTSLDLIHLLHLSKTAKIIDVGGGDSKLVDHLLDEGFENITVLDISAKALDKAKKRLDNKAEKVNWVVSDVTNFTPDTTFDLWHDRATFHFLTAQEQIFRYVSNVQKAVAGYLIIATFSNKGPKKCSGLDVRQYSAETLAAEFEKDFDKIRCMTEDHVTPFGAKQNFIFCSFKRHIG